eukprot:354384-Chlamydomonas_euryale.AAC.1
MGPRFFNSLPAGLPFQGTFRHRCSNVWPCDRRGQATRGSPGTAIAHTYTHKHASRLHSTHTHTHVRTKIRTAPNGWPIPPTHTIAHTHTPPPPMAGPSHPHTLTHTHTHHPQWLGHPIHTNPTDQPTHELPVPPAGGPRVGAGVQGARRADAQVWTGVERVGRHLAGRGRLAKFGQVGSVWATIWTGVERVGRYLHRCGGCGLLFGHKFKLRVCAAVWWYGDALRSAFARVWQVLSGSSPWLAECRASRRCSSVDGLQIDKDRKDRQGQTGTDRTDRDRQDRQGQTGRTGTDRTDRDRQDRQGQTGQTGIDRTDREGGAWGLPFGGINVWRA